MSSFFRIACLVMTMFAAAPGLAQARDASAAPASALHEIQGFRSARFGMDEAAVRTAIAHDFRDFAPLVQKVDNPVDLTQVLILPLASLDPGPGPASVSYILGAQGHKLIQINVLWRSGPKPAEAERSRLATAAVQLSSYFQALRWKPKGTSMGRPAGPNAMILFAGIDPHNAMVEVSLAGIPIRGKDGSAPPPEGPASLRVAYLSTIGPMDVARPAKN